MSGEYQNVVANRLWRRSIGCGMPVNQLPSKDFVAMQFGIYARAFLYNLMWEVACADGVLHPHEKTILSDLPESLGLPPDSFDMEYARHVSNRRQIEDKELEDKKRSIEIIFDNDNMTNHVLRSGTRIVKYNSGHDNRDKCVACRSASRWYSMPYNKQTYYHFATTYPDGSGGGFYSYSTYHRSGDFW